MVISTLSMEQSYLRDDRQRRHRNDTHDDKQEEGKDGDVKEGEENQVLYLIVIYTITGCRAPKLIPVSFLDLFFIQRLKELLCSHRALRLTAHMAANRGVLVHKRNGRYRGIMCYILSKTTKEK